mmetsp:Transcript_7778/g.22785  ORF Transcript_7778/g.22785 Transcript_7778/m.22785 type:complete len:590 (-) Transcript_7778:3832-5601(-)
MPGTNEALADAFSGVVGTLVSLWCFYPIERLKTNVQAGTTNSLSSSTTMPLPLSLPFSSSSSSSSPSGTYSLETILKWFRQSFRGCGTKSLHATASSFCYFYFYSWILSVHHARRRKRKIAGPLRPSTGLVLAAIAAMMNTFVTLPLDVLSSRRTVGNGDSEAKATFERNATTGTTGTGTKTKTKTTTTKTKTMTAKSAESAAETSQSKASEDQPHRAMMAKAWNSIGKGEAPGQNPSSQKAPTASTSLASSASTSSSPSSEDSPVVELVFHEACGCSEDLLYLDRDGNGNITINNNSNASSNANSNINSNSSHNSGGSNEEADDRDHDNKSSHCSQGSSGSGHTMVSQNEEYKTRWREHQLQRQADRKRRRQLQEPPRQPQPQPQPQLQPTPPPPLPLPLPALRIKMCFRKWTRLWKGLAPALLLCSNPSIHYTVFDVLKTNLLAYKTATKRTNPKLSVSEAFVLGLLSKFVATIVTYPLIRAKVLMMVRGDDDDDHNDDHNDDDPSRETSRESQRNTLRTSSSSSSLVSVLQESYHRDGGLKGLYKGCDWQLIHTLLKSALMMAIREQITGTSRALFGVRPAARASS